MNTDVRNKLIDVARKKGIIYYQQLCDQCNLKLDMYNNPQDRLEIGRILGEITEYEYQYKRPLISAVVLTQTGEEGDGFYKLCEQLGITGDWRKLKNAGVFAVEEIKRCHEFWSNVSNYNSFR
jgi:hypothetical protein